MGRKNCVKRPQKMVLRPRAGNEKSLPVNFARASVTETETVIGKEIKGTRTVIANASGTVETKTAIRIASRTGSVIENGTEERIMTKRVEARNIINIRTTTATDDVPHETMGGETGIRIGMLIKTRIGKGIGPRSMGIIEMRTKKTKNGRKMEEETAKRGTVLEIGLMMRLRRSVKREREVPHYSGRKGLEINATCMTIVCKMIELKKSVIIFRLLLSADHCFSVPDTNVRIQWRLTVRLLQQFELKRQRKEKSSISRRRKM
jgi:hypothetical protein